MRNRGLSTRALLGTDRATRSRLFVLVVILTLLFALGLLYLVVR